MAMAFLVLAALAPLASMAKADTPSGGGMSLTTLTTTPTGPAAPTPAGSSAPIADQIEAVARENQFANTYAGTQVNLDGTVTIYSTSAGQGPLASALETALGSAANGSYNVQIVPYSGAQLEAQTLQIANSGKAQGFTNLATAPFGIVGWGPDPVSGTVQFTVIGDATSALRQLQAMFPEIPVSAVTSTSLSLPRLATNRYYDNPSYSNGDRIDTSAGDACTEGFAIIGLNSGHIFGVTAGHCGGGTITQDGATVGTVSTRYFSNNGPDFETYPCNCRARVWYEGQSIGYNNGYTHSTNSGYCACGKGQLVTFDGATTGEAPDFTVQNSNPLCIQFAGGVTTCGLNNAKRSGVTGVQGGDSGGPVYQRSSNNSVYATGTIVGTDGSDNYYQEISVVLNDANGSILSGN